tara:strand:+ start:1202 stop:1411 length:210 start_codon:yes stop_codon:yes gene_type:complete
MTEQDKSIPGLKEHPSKKFNTTKAQRAISRSQILDEIWAADKHTHNGHWYVKLSDVAAILGEDHAKQEG